MEIQVPPFLEKRQFGRITISEPQICQVHVPKSQELWVNQGIIRNICLEGIYFISDSQPPLEKNEINNLTFDILYNDQKMYQLKFHVLVVRTEYKQQDYPQYGVALKLLSDPIYIQLKEINSKDFPLLDKTRILYQNYQLNRKAYEIIKNTPEVRSEKITSIKARIDQGLYKIESDKLAQSFTDNLLKENIVIPKK